MIRRTKITLTIVGLLALTGICYAATPTPFTPCQFSTSSSSNFNNFSINTGNYLWFTSVLKAQGLGTTPVTITFTNQTITSPNFNLNLVVPDATVTFDPAVNFATTTFGPGGVSTTTVPSNPTLKGNTFFSALSFLVPANLPRSVRPVIWSGTISTDTPGVKVNWQWAAAVYTNFNADYTLLGVKPVDDKVSVIGGATGGGGHNFTGSLGPSKTVGPCQP